MAKAGIYNNGVLAGHLEKRGPADYHFLYEDSYWADSSFPAISLTLPKTQQAYQSQTLFPFFCWSAGRRN